MIESQSVLTSFWYRACFLMSYLSESFLFEIPEKASESFLSEVFCRNFSVRKFSILTYATFYYTLTTMQETLQGRYNEEQRQCLPHDQHIKIYNQIDNQINTYKKANIRYDTDRCWNLFHIGCQVSDGGKNCFSS